MLHNEGDYAQKVSREFGVHADDYDSHSGLQSKVASELITYCPDVEESRPCRILEIGCGTGHFTQQLLDKYPDAEFVITDINPDMRDACRTKCGEFNNIEYHAMNGEYIDPALGKFDLVTSSMAVQWFQTPKTSIEKLAMLLKDHGVMTLSTLAQGYWPEWRQALKENDVVSSLISAPELPQDMLIDTLIFKEQYSSSIDFLRRLEKTGASTSIAGSGQLSVKELRPVMRTHNKNFKSQITWNIAIGHWRP